MICRHLHCLLLVLSLLSCAPTGSPAPPHVGEHSIAVLPPYNRTGEPLLISSSSFWEPDIAGVQRQTVVDVLAEQTRQQLEQYGFTTVTPEVVHTALADRIPRSAEEAADLISRSKLNGGALYIEIIRWEPDIPLHPRRILVALYASLINIASGRPAWFIHIPLHPISTPGIANRWIAYMIAAHQAAEELLAPLNPGNPLAKHGGE